MQCLADELAFIGSHFSDDDLIIAILNGLGLEYNSFVVSTTTASRFKPYTFSEIRSSLMSFENLIQGQSGSAKSLSSLSSPAAFYSKHKKISLLKTKPNPLQHNPITPTRQPIILIPTNTSHDLIIILTTVPTILTSSPIISPNTVHLLLAQELLLIRTKHSSGLNARFVLNSGIQLRPLIFAARLTLPTLADHHLFKHIWQTRLARLMHLSDGC